VTTLGDSVTYQQAQITALEKQLADARQQAQDISVKAIEGPSGARPHQSNCDGAGQERAAGMIGS
jgi:hypothetical protein